MAQRFIGTYCAMRSRLRSDNASSTPAVSTSPGSTVFTVMPYGASSSPAARASPVRPALEVA